MAIYQGDIEIHDIKLGSIDVFEIYQGSKLVYPENTEIIITFKLNVSGTVTINGYTPVISENNTKFVFTIPVKTDYTANITAEHYKSQTISGNSGYLPITHNVELEWEQRFISYTVTFPTDGVKVLFDGIEKGVITNGKLVVLIDDTEAKDSYTVTFKGSKASIYDTSTLTVVDSAIANTGGSYDLKLPTSPVKSGYKRTDYASSTGSITKGSTYAGTWIETVVSLTASFTSSTTLGSISNNVLTIANNESTNTKSGTLTVTFTLENKQTKEVSAALNQAAGAKVYTDWVLDLQTDGTSVEAKGGTRTITANVARRTYKWNNTGTVYSETATPTLSISGSASLNGNSIIFTSNESVSARSATLTASYVGLSKTVTITQQAGAKVYSAWSAWTVSISASTQTIVASGGSSTITTNASRSRTWTWNGVGTTHTDTETATPTLSGSAGGFTLSGKTVTASNNTTTNSRSITITATSNSVSKSITITQSAGAKVYGNWSAWTVNISADKTSIGATGGIATVSTSASRTRSYTWNGVAGSGGTETENGTPTLSKVSGDGNWTSPKVTYGNNTSTSGKSTVIRATIDSATKNITISQSAGAKTNITSNTRVLFGYGYEDSDYKDSDYNFDNYTEAINNTVYINNAKDWNGISSGVFRINIAFKVIITESYKWNGVGNTISSEYYGSIQHNKNNSFAGYTDLLEDTTEHKWYGGIYLVGRNNADAEEFSATYKTSNNIVITLYVRRPQLYWQIHCNAILEQTNQPFIVNVNNVTRTKLYNHNTITEGCAGSGEQYLYLFSTSNMTTSRSITVKLIRNNNPNDACKLTDFTNINTHTKTSVSLEENKTVIKTFVTSYIQTLPIDLCRVTFKYVELNFKIFIAKGTGN